METVHTFVFVLPRIDMMVVVQLLFETRLLSTRPCAFDSEAPTHCPLRLKVGLCTHLAPTATPLLRKHTREAAWIR